MNQEGAPAARQGPLSVGSSEVIMPRSAFVFACVVAAFTPWRSPVALDNTPAGAVDEISATCPVSGPGPHNGPGPGLTRCF